MLLQQLIPLYKWACLWEKGRFIFLSWKHLLLNDYLSYQSVTSSGILQLARKQQKTPKDLYCIDHSQVLYVVPGLSQLILS